ncbi:MAG TPA: alpha/beta fold hydrolase [Vicinamibacterales bacterium]|jgi:pimeloyl-ACP methyl ester carboxylesterase
MLNRSRRLLVRVIAPALALACCASCAKPAPPVSPDRITWFPYVFRANDGQALQTEFGRLKVLENRAAPASKSIELAFVRIKSTSKNPGPPIILVAGGPGSSGIDMPRSTWFQSLPTLLPAGDVIALDQRGVGQSRPTLECAETIDLALDAIRTRETYAREIREKARACAAYWRGQGIDLAAYNTESSADDIDEVRAALGAEKMVLIGGSYGSHLMLSTIRRHGDHVARAILSGTEGPDHTIKLPSNTEKQLDKIATAAAADPKVGKLVPDFVGLVKIVLDRLEKAPATAEATEPRTNRKVKVTVSKFDLQLVTGQGLGSSAFIRQLPAAYYDMAHGDFTWLAQEILNRRGQPIGSAMGYQVDCASGTSEERVARIRREAGETLLGDVEDFPIPDVCDAWMKRDLGPAFRSPIASAVPVLFFTGTLDGRTPPTNAEEIKAGFAHSAHIVVENGTHSGKEVMFTLPATKEAVAAFLRGETINSTTAALPAWEFALPKTAAGPR